MLSAAEIENALTLGYESRHLELKTAGDRSDKQLLAKVTRAALGMGNLRDGGHVIIGIDDKSPQSLLPGLTAPELASWLAKDDLARGMNEYADPPLDFEVAEVELSSGSKVAVIEVHEFADIPHLCARQRDPDLRKGALYVRPRKVAETSEIATSVDMREVIDLAIEKGLRAYVQTSVNAGVTLVTGSPPAPAVDDAELFLAQQKDAWT